MHNIRQLSTKQKIVLFFFDKNNCQYTFFLYIQFQISVFVVI